MRFGILTQYYPPEIGAPQARLHELAQLLVAAGHEVLVLTAMPSYPRGRTYDGYGGLFRAERIDGVRVLRAWAWPTQSVRVAPRLGSYLSFAASSLALGALTLPRLDVLITESPPLFLGVSGWLLARRARARFVLNVSDLWPESAVRLGVVQGGRALSAAEALEAFLYQRAWLVTGQSREILSSIHARFPSVPTHHLSNGVDTRRFFPGLRSDELRRRLAGDDARTIALYAGLHGVAQGLEQVLEAAARLREVEGLAFALVGDGPEKEALAQRARSLGLANLRLLDPVPSATMPALLASADLALVPLKTRLPGAVPSKLYEAMAVGLPVVLAADGEAVEIVDRAHAGVTVRPGDAAGLASAVRLLTTNPERARALGENGRAVAVARYDRRQIVARFVAHVESRLKPRGGLRPPHEPPLRTAEQR